EELLDRGDDRTHVDQSLRRDRLDVLRRHALADDALHARETGANLVLDELADGADAPVAEVVDVIDVEADVSILTIATTHVRGLTCVQADEVLDGGHNVFDGEHRRAERGFKTELLVDLVAADLGEVVALRVEVEVVEKRTSGFGGNLLARAELAVDVAKGVLLGEDRVLLERRRDRLVAGELLKDLFARHAERLQERGHRL